MRAAVVLSILPLALTPPARAQVSVDMRALDQTGPAQAPARVAPVSPHPVPPRPVPPRPVASSPARGATAHPAVPPSGASAGKMPPAGPTPPPVAISNAPALPGEQPAGPPAATVVPPPAPATLPLPPPVRLLFGTGQTDLTPADEAAIRDLAHEIAAPDASSVNVMAYAAGKPDDASTARRLSLSRGMAVRSVLLASGVPSAQIYVRALGSAATDGPADRVELIVTRLGTVAR